jgi:hypothetical protein
MTDHHRALCANLGNVRVGYDPGLRSGLWVSTDAGHTRTEMSLSDGRILADALRECVAAGWAHHDGRAFTPKVTEPDMSRWAPPPPTAARGRRR